LKNIFRYTSILTLFISLLLTVSCTSPVESGKIRIVTTIYPYELLIKQITGEKCEVTSIVPNNVSPHSYSPTPDDLKLIETANLVFSNGLGLEIYLEKILNSLKESHLSAENILSDSIDESLENTHIGEAHNHSHSKNPHLWLDPIFLQDIVTGILSRLESIDSENIDLYRENAAKLIEELQHFDEKIKSETEGKHLSIINFHDSFYYFNKRYGINTVAVITSSPGKEPTAKELSELGEVISANRVKVIFLEPQLNPKAGEIIANEYKIALDYLDPLGSREKTKTIVGLLSENWNTLNKYLD